MSGKLRLDLVKIPHRGLIVSLSIVRIRDLHYHERVDPLSAESVLTRIRGDEKIKHPVIADRKSFLVLDGVHRVEALKTLEAVWAPACMVDYDNPLIKIDHWDRAISGVSLDELTASLNKLGLQFITVPPDAIDATMADRKAAFGLITRGECFVVRPNTLNPRERITAIKEFEGILVGADARVEYLKPLDAKRALEEGKVEVVMVLPTFPKEMVLKEAMLGRPLPPKCTRHVIPGRMLNVNLPVSFLKQADPKEVYHRCVEHLRWTKLRLLPPQSMVGSRTYEEEVYVLEEFR